LITIKRATSYQTFSQLLYLLHVVYMSTVKGMTVK